MALPCGDGGSGRCFHVTRQRTDLAQALETLVTTFESEHCQRHLPAALLTGQSLEVSLSGELQPPGETTWRYSASPSPAVVLEAPLCARARTPVDGGWPPLRIRAVVP